MRSELRKIELRKKEREKKTADLQKLIARSDSGAGSGVHQATIVKHIKYDDSMLFKECCSSHSPIFLLEQETHLSTYIKWQFKDEKRS